jgi:hypothetical protein
MLTGWRLSTSSSIPVQPRGLKAWSGALAIFLAHPSLLPCWSALPGVAAFRRAWYRAILDT